MVELTSSSGWGLLKDALNKKQDATRECIMSGKCKDMEEYLVKTSMIQFIDEVLEMPHRMVEEQLFQEQMAQSQEDEWDGS